jgi:hypothetical protein
LLPRDEHGRVVVRQPFPNVARLFGVGFMLPGVKLAWDLIQALIEVGRAGAWRLADVFGFGIWLMVILVCLVPGWIIATIRRKVVIDPGHGTVLQVNDFLVYRWSSSRTLREFAGVRLFIPRSSSTRARARVNHHVTLTAAARKDLLVYMEEDEDDARAVAQEIAAFCALPFRDDVKDAVQPDDESTDEAPEDSRSEEERS